jgi:LSD1 subclass zinc finger protein
MAGTLPPKLKALLDYIRGAELLACAGCGTMPAITGEHLRMQIDQVEAEVTDVMLRLQRAPEAP